MNLVKVGVAVCILKWKHNEWYLLIGKRGYGDPLCPIDGAGEYQLPGGHLEFGESFHDCAIRELEEETQIRVSHESLHMVTALNDARPAQNRHYVCVYMVAVVPEYTESILMEPTKCDYWMWLPLDSLPQLTPLFVSLKRFVEHPRGLHNLQKWIHSSPSLKT
jgi:8-oxo-dGTP diphosphatase